MERAVLVSSFNHRYLARIKAANAQLSTAALVEEAPANPVDLLRSLQAQAYHPPAEALTPALIATLRRQGFGVNVWTINETASMQQLLEAGVSGLFTDFPQRLTVLIQQ
jgi:glycerophosphoryl diester phosphodiesterase